MIGCLRNSDELKLFDINDMIAIFDKVTASFNFDVAIGKAEALKIIGKLRGHEDQARLMIRVACVIGASDGNFDNNEKATIRKICRDLGLDPASFDL